MLLLAATSLFSCTGDCLTCHPKLVPTIQDDERHRPMLTCIKCHSPEGGDMAECGSDCFGCHPIEIIEKANVPEHAVIRGCRDCHVKLNKMVSDISGDSGQSQQPTLKEMLLP